MDNRDDIREFLTSRRERLTPLEAGLPDFGGRSWQPDIRIHRNMPRNMVYPIRGMYLDATSPQSRLGPIPSMDARAVALRMDAGPAEIVQLRWGGSGARLGDLDGPVHPGVDRGEPPAEA